MDQYKFPSNFPFNPIVSISIYSSSFNKQKPYFQIYKTMRAYCYRVVDGMDILFHSPIRYSSPSEVYSIIQEVIHYSQNPFNYELRVALSGAYYWVLIHPVTSLLLAKAGEFESEKMANQHIEDLMWSIKEFKIVDGSQR